MQLSDEVIKAFWSHVINNGPDQCWGTNSYKEKNGYTRLMVNYKRYLTHRLSYTIHNPGINIENLEVIHTCDNPSCTNPSHLKAGTQQDNMDDKVNKNRQAKQKGEQHGVSKLTERDIKIIFIMFYKYKIPQAQIAIKFNVASSLICLIINRKNWKHVEIPKEYLS